VSITVPLLPGRHARDQVGCVVTSVAEDDLRDDLQVDDQPMS
jgi:hypothetical protein